MKYVAIVGNRHEVAVCGHVSGELVMVGEGWRSFTKIAVYWGVLKRLIVRVGQGWRGSEMVPGFWALAPDQTTIQC